MNDESAPRDFLPTASVEMLRIRARLLAAVRSFFDARGYWEVETPLISHDGPVDPHLEPFVTRWLPAGTVPGTAAALRAGIPLFLQTSPEFGMKRLLVAGADAIYQLSRAFRNGELGTWHNPEFTMLEWYRAGDTHHAQMQVVEDLTLEIFSVVRQSHPERVRELAAPFARTTYAEAFLRHVGAPVLTMTGPQLKQLALGIGIAAPSSLDESDRDGWLNLLLAERVEPALGRSGPEFLHDYPASQAALARIRPGDPPVAERFELYLDGVELCNGYRELTEPVEMQRRIEQESLRRVTAGFPPLSKTNRLLQAMESGLPDCAGVALGFDRLLMLATGARSMADVIAFPFDRA